MAKALLAKVGTFDKLPKEKVQLMHAIATGIEVNWAAVLFKVLLEMVQKKGSTGFAVQISKLLKDAGFPFTVDKDGSSVTMVDADNVVALRPKSSVT